MEDLLEGILQVSQTKDPRLVVIVHQSLQMDTLDLIILLEHLLEYYPCHKECPLARQEGEETLHR